jgi:5-methylcytosine-specific restriction endonuclease McrA
MNRRTREFVRHRAGNRCEYCDLPHELSPVAQLQIEHIIPRKHGGGDEDHNLALACVDCNLAKSSNLTGIDPATSQTVQLFNPRSQHWHDHFAWQGTLLVGLTPVGRATTRVLNINDDERQRVRLAADQSHP